MAVLLMRLKGPMQSWGTKSKFYDRDTESFPSKSGVVGIVCAALGRDRSEDISDIANLKFGVRILESGHLKKEYQVAGIDGFMRASGSVERKQAIPYTKHYISDADFLVGFEDEKGNSLDLLKQIHSALKKPKWALSLGRKSYLPSIPIWIENGIVDGELYDCLKNYKGNNDFDSIKDIVKKNFKKDEKSFSQIFIIERERNDTVHSDTVKQTRIQDQPKDFDKRNFFLREVDFRRYTYKKSDFADWLEAEGGNDETL